MTDEVKRCVEALRMCDLPKNVQPVAFYVCRDCLAYEADVECRINLTAAGLIESLAAELEQVKQERDGLNILLGQAQSMLETRTRERNAAIADMERLQGLICQVCKEYYQPDPKSREHSCRVYGDYFGEIAEDGLLCCGKFKWRGVQEEKYAE